MRERYHVISEINQGGVGVVLKAWDTRLNRNVAIKRFLSREHRLSLGGVDEDLLREASTLSSIHHPNIVSVYDVDMEAPNGPEVIMEYLNGQDLEQAVAHAALTLDDFYQIAQQTLDALSNAHGMSLLHRDIKPSNIQVTWMANGKFVSKFVDFGLAKFFEKPLKQTVRHDGTVMGSVYYMAPEQLERQPLDHRSDIYSLGCVFYFALTMHRPHEGETVMDVINARLYGKVTRIRDYRPNVPRNLEKWVEWLMQRNPDRRPDSADVALAALRQIMAGQFPEIVPGIRQPSQPVNVTPSALEPAPATQDTPPSAGPQSPASPHTGTSPAGQPVAPPAGGSGRSRKSLLIGGMVATVALAAGISLYLARRDSGDPSPPPGGPQDSPGLKPETVGNSPPPPAPGNDAARLATVSRPPKPGLLLWFEVSTDNTFADASRTPSLLDGRVGQWQDNAPAGGFAVFQYTASVNPQRADLYPFLRMSAPETGLKRTRRVLAFDGEGDTLCIRDQDKTGDKIGASLDSGNVSVLMVFRSTCRNAPEGLLLARDHQRNVMWSLGIKDGGLIGTAIKSPPLRLPDTENQFHIASLTLDATTGTSYLALISSDGRRVPAQGTFPAAVPGSNATGTPRLEVLRMGTPDGYSNRPETAFKGEIAELLVYNEALTVEARQLAEDYLREKFFGSRAPTISISAN